MEGKRKGQQWEEGGEGMGGKKFTKVYVSHTCVSVSSWEWMMSSQHKYVMLWDGVLTDVLHNALIKYQILRNLFSRLL